MFRIKVRYSGDEDAYSVFECIEMGTDISVYNTFPLFFYEKVGFEKRKKKKKKSQLLSTNSSTANARIPIVIDCGIDVSDKRETLKYVLSLIHGW